MLQGEFFKIISSELLPDGATISGSQSISALVSLDPGHPIYGGHFPGNPVVPGVCQVQMVREALEILMDVKGMLVAADNIKFLNMIVPSEHPVVAIDYTVKPPETGNLHFSAILRDNETIFMKFKGTLCIKPY